MKKFILLGLGLLMLLGLTATGTFYSMSLWKVDKPINPATIFAGNLDLTENDTNMNYCGFRETFVNDERYEQGGSYTIEKYFTTTLEGDNAQATVKFQWNDVIPAPETGPIIVGPYFDIEDMDGNLIATGMIGDDISFEAEKGTHEYLLYYSIETWGSWTDINISRERFLQYQGQTWTLPDFEIIMEQHR